MITKELINKKTNEKLVNKDGVTLTENIFEYGDEFIPQVNKVFENSKKVLVDGKNKTIVSYSILCSVRHNEKLIRSDNENKHFVKLTPTQANSIKKLIDKDIDITQEIFTTYNYKDLDDNTWLGVGLKRNNVKAKTFEDFENE